MFGLCVYVKWLMRMATLFSLHIPFFFVKWLNDDVLCCFCFNFLQFKLWCYDMVCVFLMMIFICFGFAVYMWGFWCWGVAQNLLCSLGSICNRVYIMKVMFAFEERKNMWLKDDGDGTIDWWWWWWKDEWRMRSPTSLEIPSFLYFSIIKKCKTLLYIIKIPKRPSKWWV